MRNLTCVFYPGDEDFAGAEDNVVFIFRASCAPSYIVLPELCVSEFKKLGCWSGTWGSSYKGTSGRQQLWQWKLNKASFGGTCPHSPQLPLWGKAFPYSVTLPKLSSLPLPQPSYTELLCLWGGSLFQPVWSVAPCPTTWTLACSPQRWPPPRWLLPAGKMRAD